MQLVKYVHCSVLNQLLSAALLKLNTPTSVFSLGVFRWSSSARSSAELKVLL